MLTRAATAIRTARTARSMSLAHGKDPAYMKTPESFQKVLDTFAKYRACAVLRTPTAEAAPKAMDAAINGGFEIVEFTLTTPGCLDCVADYRAKYDGKVMVGCGTVMDINDAKKAMDAGSEFLVAPVRRLTSSLADGCVRHAQSAEAQQAASAACDLGHGRRTAQLRHSQSVVARLSHERNTSSERGCLG